MAPKDQDLFDVNWVFNSLDSFSENVEAHLESVAQSLQETFRQTPWLPDSMKPRAAAPSHNGPTIRAPVGYYEWSKAWISEHRAVSAAVVAFIGTGVFIIWRRRRSDHMKRRAKRAKNGARSELVVLAGSPHSPLTKSLSSDLERRGFIVYILVNTLSEEQLVQSMSRADLKSLRLDITSESSTEETIQKLQTLLTTPQRAIPNSPPHTLHLTAFILLPSSDHTSSPVTSLSASTWSDALNTHLLAPFATIHAFLPLLTSQRSTLLFLNPSIPSSLAPPLQATESVVAGGLQQYISTLRREVQSQGVNVAQIKLGHFDLGALSGERQQLVHFHNPSRAELTKQRLQEARKGSSLRKLHNGVFDAIERRRGAGGTVFLGRGSRTYDLVGRLVPEGVVGWMMGMAREPAFEGKGVDTRGAKGLESRGSDEGSAEWEKIETS